MDEAPTLCQAQGTEMSQTQSETGQYREKYRNLPGGAGLAKRACQGMIPRGGDI